MVETIYDDEEMVNLFILRSKNKDFLKTIPKNSTEKYWWQYSCGHKIRKTPLSMSKNRDCQKCSKEKIIKISNKAVKHKTTSRKSNEVLTKTKEQKQIRKRKVTDKNSLSKVAPHLLKDWDYEKNIIYPDQISYGNSRIKVWWKCSKGHSYKSTPYNRKQGKSCGYCSGRLVDLKEKNVKKKVPSCLIFWSQKNLKDPSQTYYKEKCWWKCPTCENEWQAVVSPRMNCPYCSNRKILKGFNDLETTHPELAKEWSSKNYFKANEVVAGTHKRAIWKCSENHEWEQQVGARVTLELGCPVCANQKIVSGINDFATKFPELMKEWDEVKNTERRHPSTLKTKDPEKVWWNCSLGHSWEASYASRANGRGCRYCGGKEILPGINDLASQRSELTSFWVQDNPPMNNIFVNSTKTAKWLCAICSEEFESSPHSIGALPLCKKCSRKGSILEKSVLSFIKKLTKSKVLENDKSLLGSQELDIYIPDLKIAIEVNGDYWHSTKLFMELFGETALERHERKLEAAAKRGVTLAFVWESDWKNKRNSVEEALILFLNTSELLPILTKLEGPIDAPAP